jgi:hypothetical protein
MRNAEERRETKRHQRFLFERKEEMRSKHGEKERK